MRKSSGEPKSIEAEIESSNSEEQEQERNKSKSKNKRKVQTFRRRTNRSKTPLRMRKPPSPTIGGALRNRIAIGLTLPAAVRLTTSLLQRSRAQPMSISAATRPSFH